MSDLLEALENFGRTTGDYWSKSNADFEVSNPGVVDRVIRSVNPVTGFGSAVGAMKDAAANGFDPVETGVAAAQAWPAFGYMVARAGTAAGAYKAIPIHLINDYLKTLRNFALGTGASVAADVAQAQTAKDRHE